MAYVMVVTVRFIIERRQQHRNAGQQIPGQFESRQLSILMMADLVHEPAGTAEGNDRHKVKQEISEQGEFLLDQQTSRGVPNGNTC